MSSEDEISPLPTKGVTFKDFNGHLPDIKEATLEGSQFEAPVYTGALSPPDPPDSRIKQSSFERGSEIGNIPSQRPKTTVRRTVSEKSLQDEELTISPNMSRKPSQDSLRPVTGHPRKSSPGNTTPRRMGSETSLQDINVNKSPSVSRKPTQDSLRPVTGHPRKSSSGNTTPRGMGSETSFHDINVNKSPSVSRKPTQDSLRPGTVHPRKSSPGNITPRRQSPANIVPKKQSDVKDKGRPFTEMPQRKTPVCDTPDSRSHSELSRRGTNGESNPQSRSQSRKESAPVVSQLGMRSALRVSTGDSIMTPESSRDIIQRKGKVVNDAWSSTTLSSQATTETTDELEDHINVVLRVRPLNTGEVTRKDQFTCSFPGAGKIEVDNAGSVRQFGYNVVFEPEASQEDLFDHSGVKKLIDMALNGYACTALAFGQTGSGKTHTMTGPPQQFQEGKQVDPNMYGIIQRSLKYMFEQLHQQGGTKVIRASYLEIYNEQVIDLLNPNMRRYLQVRWSKNKGFYVENLFVVECESDDDLMAVLEEGMRNRQTGSHGLNEFSSRSHSMLMLTIDSEQQDPEDENLFITKRGKLTFVDLAGSEKVKDSNSTAETLVESNNINRSLLILGNCISSLGDAKRRQGHIPYRDSKLTKLLADSLGGNGVTLMICCITPSSHHASETMNTLRYASRAKKIRTKPVIKMDPREKLILSLKKEIKVLRNENHYLRQQLEFPAKPKGQLQKENDQKFLKLMKETNGKPNPPNNTIPPQEKLIQNGAKDESGLYEMLQEYMVENESLRTENSEMQVSRDKLRQEQQVLYRDNEKLMKRVDDLERRVNQAQNSWQAMPRQASYPDHVRSRDQSPNRGSPQYVAAGGSGNRQPPSRVPPPPDLHLRDPVYTGSPSQGYNSPTGSGNKGKQPNRGQPLKPPHRLNDNLPPQRPVHEMNGHPPPAPLRQNPGSPNRSNDLRMDSRRSSQSSSSDAIRDMNEKLKQELMQLEGQIHQHNQINHRNRDVYGSQGSIR